MFEVTRPALLWLLIVLPWFWWVARSARQRSPRVLACRTAVAALLVFSAAGVRVAVRAGEVNVVYALDRSDSLPSRTQERLLNQVNDWAAGMDAGDRAGLIVFGAHGTVERALSETLRISEISSAVPTSATDIAAALAMARSTMPATGARRIVLLSDGCETRGEAHGEAALAAAAGVPIDVVVPEAGSTGQRLTVAAVGAPEVARIGEPFRVTAEITGRPGAAGSVRIRRDGELLGTEPVVIAPDGSANVILIDTPGTAGLHTYRASIQDELDPDEAEHPSDPGAVVAVTGVPSVLVASAGRSIGAMLSRAGFSVTRTTPRGLPPTIPALARFDAVVLDGVSSEELSRDQSESLARYVTDTGGGLLLLGGPHSLSPAGYPSGPIGPVLPVDLRPRSGRRAPSMAFVFVFDKSGSMADLADGVAKIDVARTAALQILEVVPPSDQVGVIAFDASPTIVVPLSASQSSATLTERLRSLEPSGSTAMAPAVELAVEWLRAVPPSIVRRHLLLLSDGRTPQADTDRLRVALRGTGIELSVVAIGADADRTTLERLARATGGRAIFPTDIRQLPLLVAREAARSAGGGLVNERFVPRIGNHPATEGLDPRNMPELGGYVVSAAKPGTETLLLSHLADPVLTAWHAGLGKAAVFTSQDPSWSSGFSTWTGAPRLWAQTIRWLHRQVDDPALMASLTESANGAVLTVQSRGPNGEFHSGLDVRASVRSPLGDSRDIVLDAVAPGRYEAAMPVRENGVYAASITARGAALEREPHTLRGFYWTGDREQRGCPWGGELLVRLAETSGGRLLGPSDNPFTSQRIHGGRDISSWLAAAALLLFFLELTEGAIAPLWKKVGGARSRRSQTGNDQWAA